jgi:small subunit ribosomal protein S9
MAIAKIIKKGKKTENSREVTPQKSIYYAGIGRRKAAVSRVRLFDEKKEVSLIDAITINERKLKDFFPLAQMQEILMIPLRILGEKNTFRISVKVTGGGIRGQAEATQLGLARAIVKFDEKMRKALRDLGCLTRDSRIVERKKAGLRKARRAPEFSKR